MKYRTPPTNAPEQSPKPLTVNQRLAKLIDSSLNEIFRTCPGTDTQQFEAPIDRCNTLLKLDERRHCLHRHRLLQHLFLLGVEHGIKLGTDAAAKQVQQYEKL